jgi:hypothetical protein
MAKCPNQNCQSTEFKSERIYLDGGGVYVIVCKKCETIIGISPKEINLLLNELKGKK